jgi:hypothetical protein
MVLVVEATGLLKLQLEYMHGCLMNTSEALQIMPVQQRTVRQYAAEVAGR